jgi:molybdopterin molybdotransferase
MTSGAGILSSLAKADGFIIVPEELEGIEAGQTVEVTLIE